MSAAHDEAWDIAEPVHPVAKLVQQRASEAEARLAETRDYLTAAEAALDDQSEQIRHLSGRVKTLTERCQLLTEERAGWRSVEHRAERDSLTAAFCCGLLVAFFLLVVCPLIAGWIA